MTKLRNTSNHFFHFGATPKIFERAQQLRKQTTEAEEKLWEQLRNRRFEGLKFRRQHPLNRFVADFYCHEKRLVVEVDGGIHNEKEVIERDEGREVDLQNFGLTIIRFTNEEIMTNMGEVLEKLKIAIQ